MNNNKVWRNAGLYIVIVLIAVAFISTFFTHHPGDEVRSYSEFLHMVENRQLKSVQLRENLISGETVGGARVKTMAPTNPQDPDLIPNLVKNGVDIKVLPPEQSAWWISLLSSVLLPILIFVGLWVFMLRQAQSGSSQAMSFGKSRAKLMMENKTKITFADVAGVDEAKQELEEVVEFLKAPEKFQALGAKIPRGVLLVGAPGTGKTLLARAIAGEAGVPFFSISGSDFVEMFVGVGASRVRDLFDQAKKQAPCIVFVDEIDAVGRQRGAGLGGGHDEREQTLNQLLVEMDGFEANNSVIVIAATNRPDILDSALLRPGRFDRQVVVDLPDVVGREQILKVHSRGKPLAPDVDLKLLAKRTPGFTGADLANLMNEAALLAARRDKKHIEMWDVEQSIDKVIAGPEKKNRIISDQEKKIIAVHEMGHAIMGKKLANADPVHKVTVISRGMALGVTISLPEDRVLTSRSQLLDRLAMTMGGRVAEELVFGEITTGAANDIEKATNMARKMVTEFGMSEALGPASFGKAHEHVFLGRDFGSDRNFGEEVAATIDREIRRLIDEAYDRATKILTENKEMLLKIADILIERETIDGEELERLLKGESQESVFPVPKEKPKTKELDKQPDKPEVAERGSEPPPLSNPAPA